MDTSIIDTTEDSYLDQVKSLLVNYKETDDWTLRRFLRIKNYDVEQTVEAYKSYLSWRCNEQIDNILNFAYPEIREVKLAYPHGFHRCDKFGRPVYIERIGHVDLDRILSMTTEERLSRYYIREYERTIEDRLPACSRVFGRDISQYISIFDLKGVSMSMVTKKLIDFVKLTGQISGEYYPELVSKTYLVNAPFIFSAIWKTLKGFLPKSTVENVLICRDTKILSEIIDIADLPEFLGGHCKCSNGCINSDIGPWNPMGRKLDQFGAPMRFHKHKQSISSLNTTATAATLNISYSQEEEKPQDYSGFEFEFLKELDICAVKEILDYKNHRQSCSNQINM